MGVIPTRMMAMGVRKPYDAEVEYIAPVSTASYINTGIEQTADIGFDIGFLAVAGNNQQFLGSNAGWGTNHFLFFVNNDNNLQVGYPSGPNVITGLTRNVQHVATFRNRVFTLDGTTSRTATKDPVASARTIRIIGNQYVKEGQRIYHVKLYQGSILVRDFIPVRKGTTGYLYDKVSKKLFGTAGTGSFVIGPDK